MAIDVTSFANRRATDRWNRVAVGDMLERLTWSYPDKEAFIAWEGAYAHEEHRRLTYRQADRLANQFANALLARGLANKARVLLVCENSVESFLAKLGVAKAGLVVAPVNPSLAPDVVEYLLRLVEPSFTIVDAECWPKVASAFERAGLVPDVTITIGGGAVLESATFRAFLEAASPEEPDVEIHGDDIFELQFTSGTTAKPKAVMLSHINAYMSASGFALTMTRGLASESDLRVCCFLPLIYHIGGQIFGLPVLLAGGTIVIGRRPNPEHVAHAVSRERITMLWGGSPVMVGALAEVLLSKRLVYDPRTLRVIIYGWAALSPGLVGTLKSLCGDSLVTVEIFGQTEAIACHRFWPDKWPETFLKNCPENNYVGVPSPTLASHIMDANGVSLEGKPGVMGEAVYRSPTVMAGYYKDEPATTLAFQHGWFHSGDSCVYDADGLRVMVDRSKDIVKTGGENVSSMRVEAVLHQHPIVARAAVVGLPHPRWGEAVTAVVILRAGQGERPPSGSAADEDALIAHCRQRLAGFETPKRVLFVERFPETVGGKIMKHILRAELRAKAEP